MTKVKVKIMFNRWRLFNEIAGSYLVYSIMKKVIYNVKRKECLDVENFIRT